MHEDVPLIVCGAPGGGQRFVRPRRPRACRGPVARSSTSLCATLTYVTCYVSVVCLRIGTHFVRGLRVWGRPCRVSVGMSSVLRIGAWRRDARAGRGRGRGRRTRDRPADRRRRDGRPAAPSSALAARGRPQRSHFAARPRATLSATSQIETIDCATHMYICDKYSYTVIAI
jgi:hypothetical protein